MLVTVGVAFMLVICTALVLPSSATQFSISTPPEAVDSQGKVCETYQPPFFFNDIEFDDILELWGAWCERDADVRVFLQQVLGELPAPDKTLEEIKPCLKHIRTENVEPLSSLRPLCVPPLDDLALGPSRLRPG